MFSVWAPCRRTTEDTQLTFEVLNGFHPELQGGILIAHKDRVRVLLECRDSPHVVDPFLNGLVEGKGFVRTSD